MFAVKWWHFLRNLCTPLMTLNPFTADDCKCLALCSSVFVCFRVFWHCFVCVCVGGGGQDGYTAFWTCHAHQKRMYLNFSTMKPAVPYLMHKFLRSKLSTWSRFAEKPVMHNFLHAFCLFAVESWVNLLYYYFIT